MSWQRFTAGMSMDGQLALSAVWLWLVEAYFLPGSFFLRCLLDYAPGVAQFFELDAGDYRGPFAAVVSAAAWFAATLSIITVHGMIRRADHALTSRLAGIHREARRALRVATIRMRCRAQAVRQRLQARTHGTSSREIVLDEIDLTELELEALRSHAFLAAGYVLTASDLASSLDIRKVRAQEILAKLRRLALIDAALGTGDGESGSRISGAGQLFLMARSRIASD